MAKFIFRGTQEEMAGFGLMYQHMRKSLRRLIDDVNDFYIYDLSDEEKEERLKSITEYAREVDHTIEEWMDAIEPETVEFE